MKLKVDDKVYFAEEKRAYTVQAVGQRYAVCTKPFAARKTVLYTIIDFKEEVRGTENLIFGAGFETREQCENSISRMETGGTQIGFRTEVSRRNRVPLNIARVSQGGVRG